MFDSEMYAKVINKKTTNPALKIMLAVGGATHGVWPFSTLVSSDNNIDVFVSNAINFLRQYEFDGIDLDWEYPGGHQSPASDKLGFTKLVKVCNVVKMCKPPETFQLKCAVK